MAAISCQPSTPEDAATVRSAVVATVVSVHFWSEFCTSSISIFSDMGFVLLDSLAKL